MANSLVDTITEIINVLNSNIDEYTRLEMCNNLYLLLIDYFDSAKGKEYQSKIEQTACRFAIVNLIPVVENRLTRCSLEYKQKYYEILEKSYAFASRCSLEHFCDYME